jgi:hypothetical protein
MLGIGVSILSVQTPNEKDPIKASGCLRLRYEENQLYSLAVPGHLSLILAIIIVAWSILSDVPVLLVLLPALILSLLSLYFYTHRMVNIGDKQYFVVDNGLGGFGRILGPGFNFIRFNQHVPLNDPPWYESSLTTLDLSDELIQSSDRIPQSAQLKISYRFAPSLMPHLQQLELWSRQGVNLPDLQIAFQSYIATHLQRTVFQLSAYSLQEETSAADMFEIIRTTLRNLFYPRGADRFLRRFQWQNNVPRPNDFGLILIEIGGQIAEDPELQRQRLQNRGHIYRVEEAMIYARQRDMDAYDVARWGGALGARTHHFMREYGSIQASRKASQNQPESRNQQLAPQAKQHSILSLPAGNPVRHNSSRQNLIWQTIKEISRFFLKNFIIIANFLKTMLVGLISGVQALFKRNASKQSTIEVETTIPMRIDTIRTHDTWETLEERTATHAARLRKINKLAGDSPLPRPGTSIYFPDTQESRMAQRRWRLSMPLQQDVFEYDTSDLLNERLLSYGEKFEQAEETSELLSIRRQDQSQIQLKFGTDTADLLSKRNRHDSERKDDNE